MSTTTWTPEKTSELLALYVNRMEALPEDERAAKTVEVVKEIAEEHGFAANSLRIKLIQGGVYIKKGAEAAKSSDAKSTGGARTSKATAHAELVAAFSDGGVTSDELDMEIIEKLTGKAAVHLASLVRKITK